MISIIIPSRSEGQTLLACLAALYSIKFTGEVVVAAHGETMEVCHEVKRRHPDVIWVECPRSSRGDQMNRGAAASRGGVMLFLHADTRLPGDTSLAMERAFARPDVVGGAFRLQFDVSHPVLRMLSAMSWIPWRTAFFGDQAIFCARAAFEAVGGFRDEPIFEDVDFALALARQGKLIRVDASVTTSARRFVATGPGPQIARNAVLLGMHYVGVPARVLARSYGS